MNNIIFRSLGNSVFQASMFKQSVPIGIIIGTKKENICHINNFEVFPKYRLSGYGTNLLNMFETKMQTNENIHTFRTFAWDNTYCTSTSYLQFYFKNNYSICKNSKTSYHDNGDKIYCITPVYKKI